MTATRLFRGASSLLLIALMLVSLGCQGRPKSEPPIHIVPNMDNQPKLLPQASSEFFLDGAADRLPVEGTIARGELRLDTEYYEGKTASGELVTTNPVPVTATGLARGQERFNIYCSVCHGEDGRGRGIVIEKGYTPPPTFLDDPLLSRPDGHYYDVIANGIRNMPGYANQIAVEDRWLIVQYVRALQRSQATSVSDVPVELRDDLGKQ